jgi:hypothetical protein
MEAPVAATRPTSPPSPRMNEMPNSTPNFGTRLKPTPGTASVYYVFA